MFYRRRYSTFAVNAISMEVTRVLQSSAATLLSNLADMGMFSGYFGVYWAMPQECEVSIAKLEGALRSFFLF